MKCKYTASHQYFHLSAFLDRIIHSSLTDEQELKAKKMFTFSLSDFFS